METKEYILFFFREIAVEYCEKKIFSRVARVCKNDRGGSTLFYHERWSSFLKTRLTCSIPGEFPFFFDELRKFFSFLFVQQLTEDFFFQKVYSRKKKKFTPYSLHQKMQYLVQHFVFLE